MIGDSIRLNSEKHVIKNLDKEVSLSSPSENCECSNKVREKIDSWLLSVDSFDVIHINCGLHDVRYDPARDAPVSSRQQYAENLEIIFSRLARLGARVIWATSTPIDEKMHNEVKVSRRYLKDIVAYNTASVELARNYGFEIHDLYAKVLAEGLKDILLPDGIHFNEAGNARIGVWISEVIHEAAHV